VLRAAARLTPRRVVTLLKQAGRRNDAGLAEKISSTLRAEALCQPCGVPEVGLLPLTWMIGGLGRRGMIVSCVVASARPDLAPGLNLLLLLGRSSASKDVELLVLRHEVATKTRVFGRQAVYAPIHSLCRFDFVCDTRER
jgi:hypothetical protein